MQRSIYDFSDRLPRIGVLLFPLIFVAAGLILFYYNLKIANKSEELWIGINKRKYNMVFGLLFATIGLMIFIFVLSYNMKEYSKTKKVYDEKQYKIVEGEIEQFHPKSGHDSERFTVKGIPFEYSDDDLSDYGYNTVASNGGILKENLHVRISYFNNGQKNIILKLESK